MILRTEKVGLSNQVIAITVFAFLVLFVCCIALPIYIFFTEDSIVPFIFNIFISLLVAVPITITVFMYRLKNVVLTEDSIIVEKKQGKVVLPINQISGVELYESNSLGIRTFGIGGAFGYIGKFYSKKLGNYTAYVGNCSESFFVTMKNGKKYLLSCNNHREMVEQINKLIKP